MRAAVLHGVGEPLTVEDVELDDPWPHEVLVRTAACGVCRSDLHFVDGHYATTFPVVPGHEAAGVVEAVGSEVRYVSPGDPVIACMSVFCGRCAYCTGGRPYRWRRPEVRRGPDDSPRLRLRGQPGRLSSHRLCSDLRIGLEGRLDKELWSRGETPWRRLPRNRGLCTVPGAGERVGLCFSLQ